VAHHAKPLGRNLSRAHEAGNQATLKSNRERRWKIENVHPIPVGRRTKYHARAVLSVATQSAANPCNRAAEVSAFAPAA
jgi:hypothetical protein